MYDSHGGRMRRLLVFFVGVSRIDGRGFARVGEDCRLDRAPSEEQLRQLGWPRMCSAKVLGISGCPKKEGQLDFDRKRTGDFMRFYVPARANITYLLYYVKLPENTKHSPQFYARSLEATCRTLKRHGRRWALAGDVDTIMEWAPTCKEAVHTLGRSFHQLRFPNVVQSMGAKCPTKFGHKIPEGLLQKLARIWLNKLPLLCEYAEAAHADGDDAGVDLNVIFDAGLYSLAMNATHMSTSVAKGAWNFAMNGIQHVRKGQLGLSMYRPIHTAFEPFGRRRCLEGAVETPKKHRAVLLARAMFLAIRRKDCNRVLEAYEKTLAQLHLERQVGSACPCFDEETVFTRMIFKYPGLLDTWRV
eukprot:TRINITY_DN23103_c0_g1_i1.p1 TRINITY_DN23103_c0_g1~~TRINITY_DN23103_c0_g1_i1.p1  ORF type:complete len:359 (+),score=69.04 TRINITY_DN23103_c0_g1_i1:41-1117(+)